MKNNWNKRKYVGKPSKQSRNQQMNQQRIMPPSTHGLTCMVF